MRRAATAGAVEQILGRYGLLAVFVGAYLEGDVTVILSGVVSHLGLLRYSAAVGVALVAGILRDGTCYAIGRSSAAVLQSRLYAGSAGAVGRLADRLGPLAIVVAPFVYGVRTASMVFWGGRRLSPARFLALDATANVLWVLLFSGIGYALSNQAESLIGEVEAVEKWILGALLAAVALVLAWRALARRVGRARR
jgi:membrane protein DedA with SNARE-associated domain